MNTQTVSCPRSLRRASMALLGPALWTVAIAVGAQVLTENFDGVAAPALPAGWVTAASQGPDLWVTTASSPDTPPNAAFINIATPNPGNAWLETPSVPIATSSAQIAFRHNYAFAVDPGTAPSAPNFAPVGFGYLEISIDGAPFQDMLAAGGSFVTGGYPSGGAWVESSFTYQSVLANLPAVAAGTSVAIRWRLSSVLNPFPAVSRWWLDSVRICDATPCVPLASSLKVDDAGNGVWEPGETVIVDPTYFNNGTTTIHPLGTATALDGPGGSGDYTITDSTADYGSMLAGAHGNCSDTGDCYGVQENSGVRQAPHWDAQLSESLANGVTATWTLHIGESFADTPTSNIFYKDIETVFHRGVTGGCGGDNYCPDGPALRKQMAVFLLKSRFGVAFTPPPAAGIFTDVPAADLFAPWIESLYNMGITGGCSVSPLMYCPDQTVLRKQMAVFLLKTLNGASYIPPVCQGTFDDVPCPSQFADWIEDLSIRGIAAGCGGANFCPDNPNTRGQMAVFLVKTFGLTLYGP